MGRPGHSSIFSWLLPGLVAYDSNFNDFRKLKSLFWTDNPLSKVLKELLTVMVKEKLIEFDADECKYRWNKEEHGVESLVYNAE